MPPSFCLFVLTLILSNFSLAPSAATERSLGCCSVPIFVCFAAVSCSGCGLVLGTAMELASGAAAALGSHCSAGAPCNAKGCRDSQGTACLDVTTREMSSADIAREEASGAASTEVWLLKRRLQLQAFEGAHWGDDLLHMHSDLSYFVRDLNLYSRDADILCFLLLPLSSPAAAERPWEIGALSPPSVCTPAAASASVATDAEAATTATTVPVGKPWVSLSEHEIALEVRILSRECFIVKGSQKDNGKKGCMAMKVRVHSTREMLFLSASGCLPSFLSDGSQHSYAIRCLQLHSRTPEFYR